MSQVPENYGVLDQLPPELAYLKGVAWEGALLPQYALSDDNPEYADKVYAAIRNKFAGLPQAQVVRDLAQHRRSIWDWLEQDGRGKHSEARALHFIYGLLKFPEAVFRRRP